MKTLKQILKGDEIETNENAIIECVKEWLQHKQKILALYYDKQPNLDIKSKLYVYWELLEELEEVKE